jgi:hypothetical protein
VALSGDGNTALVGGYDSGGTIAAWVFTRSNGVWTQQGEELVGADAGGTSYQQGSVALSDDGNTAIIGGFGADPVGGAWMFTRSSGVWTQQGSKLVGSGGVGPTSQGASVALSGDGSTALVGGPGDNNGTGAVWVYALSGGVWAQQGNKLVGLFYSGIPKQWQLGLFIN